MCIFDKKEKVIRKKIKRIEKETGNEVIIKEVDVNYMSDDACVNFGNWVDMKNLPEIFLGLFVLSAGLDKSDRICYNTGGRKKKEEYQRIFLNGPSRFLKEFTLKWNRVIAH